MKTQPKITLAWDSYLDEKKERLKNKSKVIEGRKT